MSLQCFRVNLFLESEATTKKIPAGNIIVACDAKKHIMNGFST